MLNDDQEKELLAEMKSLKDQLYEKDKLLSKTPIPKPEDDEKGKEFDDLTDTIITIQNKIEGIEKLISSNHENNGEKPEKKSLINWLMN